MGASDISKIGKWLGEMVLMHVSRIACGPWRTPIEDSCSGEPSSASAPVAC